MIYGLHCEKKDFHIAFPFVRGLPDTCFPDKCRTARGRRKTVVQILQRPLHRVCFRNRQKRTAGGRGGRFRLDFRKRDDLEEIGRIFAGLPEDERSHGDSLRSVRADMDRHGRPRGLRVRGIRLEAVFRSERFRIQPDLSDRLVEKERTRRDRPWVRRQHMVPRR